jgi:hypothetical protein
MYVRPLFGTVTLAALLSGAVACGRTAPAPKPGKESAPALKVEAGVPETIKTQLSTRPAFLAGDPDGEATWKAVSRFYQEREYAPAWVDGRRPTE